MVRSWGWRLGGEEVGGERRAKKGWRNVGICEGNARRKSWEIVNASLFRRTIHQKKRKKRSFNMAHPQKGRYLFNTYSPARLHMILQCTRPGQTRRWPCTYPVRHLHPSLLVCRQCVSTRF